MTCNTDISSKITRPVLKGDAMSTSPMWKTGLIAPENKYLAQTPVQLRYAAIPNTVISENLTTTKTVDLTRNVAKIQLILKEYTGFDNTIVSGVKNEHAYFELLDVPTTLSWDGKYFPSKNTPEVSNKPMREYIYFKPDLLSPPKLKADTVNFIIPAHRGDNPLDITTHKLRLKVSMPLNGNDYHGNKPPIEIPHSPKINSIIQVFVTFRGEPDVQLDIKVKVKDWVTVDEQIDDF